MCYYKNLKARRYSRPIGSRRNRMFAKRTSRDRNPGRVSPKRSHEDDKRTDSIAET